jgi:hypothetical protein
MRRRLFFEARYPCFNAVLHGTPGQGERQGRIWILHIGCEWNWPLSIVIEQSVDLVALNESIISKFLSSSPALPGRRRAGLAANGLTMQPTPLFD